MKTQNLLLLLIINIKLIVIVMQIWTIIQEKPCVYCTVWNLTILYTTAYNDLNLILENIFNDYISLAKVRQLMGNNILMADSIKSRGLNCQPIFSSPLKSLQVSEWQEVSYLLPSVYDPDNDSYNIIATQYKDGSNLPTWISFDSRKFIISPSKSATLGTIMLFNKSSLLYVGYLKSIYKK